MESATFGLGALAWEYGLKPIVDSLKKEYGETVKIQLKNGLSKAFEKLPFKKNELEIIEAEIIEADVSVLEDKENFFKFIQENTQIQELMNEVRQREPNINVVIEKSYNEILIDGNNNSISF